MMWSATFDYIGKLKNEMSTFQYIVRRMTLADTVNQIQNLGNLKLLLPEEEEVILEVRKVDKMILVDRIIVTLVLMATVVMVGILIIEISPGLTIIALGHLEIRVKIIVTLVEIK